MRPDRVAADWACTVLAPKPAITIKNPNFPRMFINAPIRSPSRLNLFFDFTCLCTSIIHQSLVGFDFFQHRNQTVGIANSVRFEFILDLLQTLRNAQTLDMDGIIQVEADRLLSAHSIE